MSQVGLQFKWKHDWKCFFQKDVWFQYQRPLNRDEVILKRLTPLNVARWYFYQIVLKLLAILAHPMAMLAHHYFHDVDGEEYKHITGKLIHSKLIEPTWFRL